MARRTSSGSVISTGLTHGQSLLPRAVSRSIPHSSYPWTARRSYKYLPSCPFTPIMNALAALASLATLAMASSPLLAHKLDFWQGEDQLSPFGKVFLLAGHDVTAKVPRQDQKIIRVHG